MGKARNINWTREELYRLYYDEQRSLSEIARIYKVNHVAVLYQMKKFGIKRRSRSEVYRLLFNQGKHRPPKTQRGELSFNWKGGRHKDKDGYIEVGLQPDDLFYPILPKRGYIREHRLVMANHLNRWLLPWEIVHHKNGIKDDNRIENLELLPTPHKHYVITKLGTELKKLQGKVDKLEQENRLLKWQIKELQGEKKPV